jgi:CubicO group peptidase (beta-lactamase class C family)
MNTSLRVLLLITFLVSLFPSPIHGDNVYYPAEEWRESSPEEQGLSSDKLQEMMTYIEDNHLQIDGIVLIRNGYLVWESYPSTDYDVDTRHFLYSVTKSFTSSLVGIAIDKGLIRNTSQTMMSFFPDREIQNLNGGKNRVTIENLLMMKSGMKWDESSAPYDSPLNDIYHLNHVDGLQYCLDLPMISEPGSTWYYNTGSSHILSGIIQASTGTSTLDFAKTYLFDLIGVDNVMWSMDLGGTYKGGFDLQLTPRDMARFGYLYLHGGKWGNIQIVSEEWVKRSTSSLTTLDDETGYGYQWWIMPDLNSYRASGLYGQQIFVDPKENIVFVLTAHISPSQYMLEESFFEKYVLASIINEDQPSGDDEHNSVPGYTFHTVVTGLVLTMTVFYFKSWIDSKRLSRLKIEVL